MVRWLVVSCFVCLVGLGGAFRHSYMQSVSRKRTSISRLSLWNDQSNVDGRETKQELLELVENVKVSFARSAATILLVSGLFLFSNPTMSMAAANSAGDTTIAIKPSSSSRRRAKSNSKSSTKESVLMVDEAVDTVPSKTKKLKKARSNRIAKPTIAPSPEFIENPVIASAEKDKRNKLMQTGLALVGINLVALFFSGDDDDSSKTIKKRSGKVTKKTPSASPRSVPVNRVSKASAPSLKKNTVQSVDATPVQEDDDDLFDIFPVKKSKPGPAVSPAASSPRERTIPSRRRNILPPTVDELVQNEGKIDDLFSDDAGSSKVVPAKNAVEKDVASEVILSKQSLSSPPPSSPAAPPKKNLLDRIFQKPGGGRPTDFNAALRASDDPSYDFRTMVAYALAAYVPPSLFPTLDEGSESLRVGGEAAQAEALRATKEDSGLSEQDAANAFAEVANAMLVNAVDRAVATLSKKNTNATISALNDVVDFIGGAGNVYGQTVPGAVIEPVVYNGKAKKGDLESCYFFYLKECMGAESLGAVASTEEPKEGEDTASSDILKKREGLGKLQVIFNIKEGKRSSLEQKAMVEVIMSMGGGDDGGMKGMFDAFGGKGGGGGGGFGPNMLNDMMSGGMGMPGMADLENMNPDQMKAASTEAVTAVS